MIGYHSVSVVADAIATGNLTGAEAMKALEASAQTARTKYYDGLEFYMKLGYVPQDNNSSSVSKTLEYAYDDWAIAQAAKKLKRSDISKTASKPSKPAQSDKNVYVNKLELNGRRVDRRYITYAEIAEGGKLNFYMTDAPAK